MSQDFHLLDGTLPPTAEAASLSSPRMAAFAALKDVLFGSAAGMVGKVLEYPFDTVKVRLQSQPDDRPLRYRGPLDCFKQSLRQDGIRGLYRGISPPLVGAAAENSALFFSYNLAQSILRKRAYPDLEDDRTLPMSALVFCGAASGAFASFILTPIELVKCKMQVQSVLIAADHGTRASSTVTRHAGPIQLVQQIYQAHGMRGLWHGQMGTFLRESGGSAAWFGAYEYVSSIFRRWGQKDTNTAGEMMMAGAAAGVSYNFTLFPADSIKSRMQTQTIGAHSDKVKGFWAVGRGMYTSGGIASLYRGCGITCLRSAPSSAIIFLVYESLKSQFS